MTKKLTIKMLSMLVATSLLTLMPTAVLASPGKSASNPELVQEEKVENLKESAAYLEGHAKAAKDMKSGTKFYIEGLAEFKEGNNKDAVKKFESAGDRYEKADDRLSELDPPEAAEPLQDLTLQALDKYKEGIELSEEAAEDDSSVKMVGATAIMVEGLKNQSKVLSELADKVREFVQNKQGSTS